MNQLQTVLDALILLGRAANISHDVSSVEAEAIAIVKQMMQAKPEIEIGVNESSACRFLPVGTKLYTHPAPQAVPVSAEPVAWRVWSPDGTNVYQYTEDGDGEPLFAAPQAVPAWLPIESAPKDGTLVVLYSPNDPDDWPDSFKVTFDYFCEDYENWFHHSEAYEHYMAVGGSNACGPDAVCTGPSEKAPYTHWMPLPAAPKVAV